jgi:hypothetical protein
VTEDEARARLAEAIADFVEAAAGFDGEMLGDWAVVAHLPLIDDPGTDSYFVGYHSEHVPAHVATGLLHAGLSTIGETLEAGT